MTEIWLAVKGYEGAYEVSSLGRVRSVERRIQSVDGRIWIQRGKMLSPRTLPNRYPHVCLSKPGGSPVNHYVHRLVAEAFISNPEAKAEINHINGDKADNQVANLEWSSRLENARHCVFVLCKQVGKRKPAIANFADGTSLYFPSQEIAEIAIRGRATGRVSSAIRKRQWAYGAQWSRS